MRYLFLSLMLAYFNLDASIAKVETHWNGSQGTLEFNPTTLRSVDGEYALVVETEQKSQRVLVWIETLAKKRTLYAHAQHHIEHFSNYPLSQHVNLSLDHHNTLTASSSFSSFTYPDGQYPLIHLSSHAYLSSFSNDSTIPFNTPLDEMEIKTGTTISSESGHLQLIFEDRGWVSFGPPSRKYNPPRTSNPTREIWVWLHYQDDSGEQFGRLHYATIRYDYTDGEIDEEGVYLIDLPIAIRLDQENTLFIETPADIHYPFGRILLNEFSRT